MNVFKKFVLGALASAALVFGIPHVPVEAQTWTSADIGSVGSAGSCTPVSTTYTVVGNGTTYGNADSFQFCYQSTSGNREVIVQVTSNTTTGMTGGQESGLMVRQSLTAQSEHALCAFSDSYVLAEWRQTNGGSTDSIAGDTILTGYLRMQVISGVPNCASSTDGTNWTDVPLGAPPVMTGTYYVGMKVDGNSVGVATGVFVNPTNSAFSESSEDTGGLRPHFRGYGTGCDACPTLTFNDPTFGTNHDNTAGRGGQVCTVNTLNGEVSGAGIQFGTTGTRSFGDCTAPRTGCVNTSATCARTVVFAISGIINLNGILEITSPYLTIAGQTAPSPGINIRGAQVRLASHDMLVQHIRFRFDQIGTISSVETIPLQIGPVTSNPQWVYNTVMDHISIAFGYGYMSIAHSDTSNGFPNPWDVSVLDSIAAFPLSAASLDYGGYGIGFWQANNGAGTAARNLVVHASHRAVASGVRQQIINNFVFGSGPNETWGVFVVYGDVVNVGEGACTAFGNDGPECKLELVGINNRFVSSQGTGSATDPSTLGSNAGHKMWNLYFDPDNINLRGDRMWLTGNDGTSETGSTGDGQLADAYWGLSSFNASQIMYSSMPSWHADMDWTPIATSGLHTALEQSVGARPADRDSVDILAVQQMMAAAAGNITGSRIRAPGDLGLDLTLTSNTHTLTLPANPNTVADAAGRTNLELWLESFATTVEDGIDVVTVSPSTGPIGSSVTVTGTGFGGTQGSGTIKFNGVPATVTSWSATSITATVPAAAATGAVTVTQLGITSDSGFFTVGVGGPSAPTNVVINAPNPGSGGSCTGTCFFVGKSGSDSNSCTTAQSSTAANRKLTVASGLSCLAPGQTLVIGNGTYSESIGGSLVNGSAGGGYVVVKAENDGGAIISGQFTTAISRQYIQFEGLRIHGAASKSIEGNHLKFLRVEWKDGPTSGAGALLQVGSNNGAASTDILFEDNWVHGFGGRYKVIIYNNERTVVRRMVIRWDGNNNPGAGEPAGNLTVYDSANVEIQNLIVLDDTSPMLGSDLYGVASICNGTVSTSNTNRFYRGVVLLNVQQPIGVATEGNCNVTNQLLQDVVVIGSQWGIDQLDGSSVQYNQITVIDNANSGFALFGGSGSVTNAISADNGTTGYTGVSPTGSVSWNNAGGAGGGTNLNPYINGLLYPVRIETGSVLESGGVSGARRGADIRFKIGTSGTLYGESGYATTTADSLWPYPNESRIKQEMCTDVSVTRGFCSDTSLTRYIMNWFGNGNPY